MNGIGVIRENLNGTLGLLKAYLSDLSDADMLVRPAEGANHIAWQVGHLIESEVGLISAVPGAETVELPDKIKGRPSAAQNGSTDPGDWLTKDQYLELFDKVRANTLATLDKLTDEDLDKPTPEAFAKYAPTIGALFILLGTHVLMHAGQFTVVRRKLGKPVLF